MPRYRWLPASALAPWQRRVAAEALRLAVREHGALAWPQELRFFREARGTERADFTDERRAYGFAWPETGVVAVDPTGLAPDDLRGAVYHEAMHLVLERRRPMGPRAAEERAQGETYRLLGPVVGSALGPGCRPHWEIREEPGALGDLEAGRG